MIRVTRNGITDLFLKQAASNSTRLGRASEVAVTGHSFLRPSDAPQSVREIHVMSAAANTEVLYGENAGSAGSHLQAMDDALARTHDVLVRLRELAVAMASETADSDGRAVAAVEVRGLQTVMLDVANSQYNGRYLFAGEAYDAPAFDAAFAYQGDTNVPEARVGEDRFIRTGLVGSDVFQGATDVFATIEALAVALEANDPTAVSATLDDLDAGTSQTSEWRGVVGAEQFAADDIVAVAESMAVLYNGRLSELIDADPAEAYTALGEAKSAYETTIQVAASSSTMSLFDLLR
jgi:flagellar hook-associated protein 3 FlgL